MATYGSHAASALAPDFPGKNSMQAFQALAVIPTVVVIAVAAGGQSVRKQEGIVYGSVYDSTMGEPLANASVFLWETPSRTETDAEGAYRLQGIPPGDYSLLFSHTRLGEVGASVGPCPISIMPGDGLRVAMGTPSTFTMVASECLTERSAPGSGTIAGWVSDSSSGMGMPGAQVTLSWDVRGTDAPGRQQLQTHSDGWYLACDAPADIPISVDAQIFDRQARLREVSVPDGGSTEAGIVLYELESTLVFGRLLDVNSGRPVEEAVVWLRGTSLRTLTDQNGRFELPSVPPGDYILMSDHLAYGTKMDTLSVPSGQRLDIEMMLDARAIEIAPITVSVRGIPLAEGAMGGIRISPEAVDKVRPVARVVVNVIRSQNIPGIIARHRSDGSVCVGYSTGQVRMMFDTGCVPMLVFLNGAPVSNTEMVYQLPPDAVDRLMIYKPLEAGNLFGLGAGNGVILIYRKGN